MYNIHGFNLSFNTWKVLYVSNIPMAAAMTFVSDELREVIASFSQSAGRYVQVGNAAEVVFSRVPGRVFAGKVTSVMDATGTAQLAPSGQLPVLTGQPSAGRYPVRIALDDIGTGTDSLLPQGVGGTVAVYTQRGKPVHIITKVVMRMQAWLGFLTSPSG